MLALRSKNKPVVGHDKFLESEMAANEMIFSIFNEEVDVDLRPGKLKMEELIGVVSNCDITFEQIAFLVDKGFVE